MFRESKYYEGFSFFGTSYDDTKFLESESIQVVSLNNKLEARSVEIKTEAINSYFADACSDTHKNIYICSFTNSSIVVEKFDSTGALLAKLTSPLSLRKKTTLSLLMKNDKDNENNITTAFIYNNEKNKVAHCVVSFDFNNNKVVKASEVILNKDYSKSLTNSNEKTSGGNFSAIEDLKLVQIINDSSRMIVVKEIRYKVYGGQGEATTNYRRGSIITVYNKKNLEVQRDIVIDKKFASFVSQSEGIYAHLVGNYLYAVTCENSGLTSFKTFVNKINLSTGEVVKTEIEKQGIGNGMVTFPAQVGWFKNNYVVPFFKVASVFSYSFESAFLNRTY